MDRTTVREFHKGDVYYAYQTPVEPDEERKDGTPVVIMATSNGNANVIYLSGDTSIREKDAVWIRSVHRKCQVKYKSMTTVPIKNIGSMLTRLSVPEMMALDAAVVRHYGLCGQRSVAPKVELVKDIADHEKIIALETERDTYKRLYEGLLGKLLGDE